MITFDFKIIWFCVVLDLSIFMYCVNTVLYLSYRCNSWFGMVYGV
jgi:hypothetical protein